LRGGLIAGSSFSLFKRFPTANWFSWEGPWPYPLEGIVKREGGVRGDFDFNRKMVVKYFFFIELNFPFIFLSLGSNIPIKKVRGSNKNGFRAT